MNPILYESRETDFNHNGLGKMNETLSAIITEVANGEFELEVVYPIGGRLYKHIQDHMLIKAKPNSVDDPHVFRIYEHTIDTVGQIVTIYAHTKSNDLGQNLVKDVVISSLTPQEAMNSMKMNLVEPTDYSFVSDITTRSSTEWKNRNPLNCIAGEEGSLIHYWGGEIKRDNRTIYLYRRRGRDNVAIIRDGKNINGLSLEYSTKGMVTKIIPYRTYTPENSDDEVIEYGTPVESQYIGNYPLVYVRAIDYSNDDNITSLQTMNTKASQYFTENNGVDKPSVNVSMGLVELSDSSEYEKFKDFENVELFDTVTVYSKQYDIHIETKITTVVYDSLTGKNISLEMGSYRTGLIESTERTYMELIGEKEAKLVQTIQVAANGKNRVFRGVTEPATGMVKNDIWYQPVGAGETMMYVFDGTHWQLNKVSAGLLGGTLDAENGDVNVINLNAASIVSGTFSGLVFFNDWSISGVTGTTTLRGDLTSNYTMSDGKTGQMAFSHDRVFSNLYNADGSLLRGYNLSPEAINFNSQFATSTYNYDNIHVTRSDGTNSNITYAYSNFPMQLTSEKGVRLGISVNGVRSPRLEVGGSGVGAYVSTNGELRMNGGKLVNPSEISFNASARIVPGENFVEYRAKNIHSLFLSGFAAMYLTRDDNTGEQTADLYAELNMQGNAITNQSDIRLKTNVSDSDFDALQEIERMKFIDYEWDLTNPYNKQKPHGRQFGIVAQYSPFLQTKSANVDSYLSVDMTKQVNLNSKAIQELLNRIKALEAKT